MSRFIGRFIGALLVVLLVAVQLGAPALAQSGCERARECGWDLAWAHPMGQVTPLYVWDPVNGYAHDTGLYGLVGFCQNYGGYYYLGDDGAWHWFDC